MGKPYRIELERFPDTLQRAARVDLGPTVALLAALGPSHLLTVGSGGSFSSAVLASQLHEFTFGRPSHPVTPLEAVQRPRTRGTAALLLSARGRNRDIVDSFHWLARSDLERIAVVATAHASPLAVAARNLGQPVADGFLDYRDGFLATNSLLMTAAVLVRGALRIGGAVEPDFRELQVPAWYVDPKESSDIGDRLAADTLIILSGSWGKTAALDLESKLTEAALANASVTDFRNFGHGRHYWLASRGARTRVVLFVTPEDRRVADRTLSTLPPEALPVVLSTEDRGPAGALDLLYQAMHLIQVLADHQNVDPGRPHIPRFGRRLYNSGATRRRRQQSDDVWLARKAAAIGLKTPRGLETALGRIQRETA